LDVGCAIIYVCIEYGALNFRSKGSFLGIVLSVLMIFSFLCAHFLSLPALIIIVLVSDKVLLLGFSAQISVLKYNGVSPAPLFFVLAPPPLSPVSHFGANFRFSNQVFLSILSKIIKVDWSEDCKQKGGTKIESCLVRRAIKSGFWIVLWGGGGSWAGVCWQVLWMHQLVGFEGRTSNDRLPRGSERVVDYSRLLACEEFVYSQASKMPQDLQKKTTTPKTYQKQCRPWF